MIASIALALFISRAVAAPVSPTPNGVINEGVAAAANVANGVIAAAQGVADLVSGAAGGGLAGSLTGSLSGDLLQDITGGSANVGINIRRAENPIGITAGINVAGGTPVGDLVNDVTGVVGEVVGTVADAANLPVQVNAGAGTDDSTTSASDAGIVDGLVADTLEILNGAGVTVNLPRSNNGGIVDSLTGGLIGAGGAVGSLAGSGSAIDGLTGGAVGQIVDELTSGVKLRREEAPATHGVVNEVMADASTIVAALSQSLTAASGATGGNVHEILVPLGLSNKRADVSTPGAGPVGDLIQYLYAALFGPSSGTVQRRAEVSDAQLASAIAALETIFVNAKQRREENPASPNVPAQILAILAPLVTGAEAIVFGTH